MKNLVLLRHAKSSWDYDVADHQSPSGQKRNSAYSGHD